MKPQAQGSLGAGATRKAQGVKTSRCPAVVLAVGVWERRCEAGWEGRTSHTRWM